jgi:hypothetical protein
MSTGANHQRQKGQDPCNFVAPPFRCTQWLVHYPQVGMVKRNCPQQSVAKYLNWDPALEAQQSSAETQESQIGRGLALPGRGIGWTGKNRFVNHMHITAHACCLGAQRAVPSRVYFS